MGTISVGRNQGSPVEGVKPCPVGVKFLHMISLYHMETTTYASMHGGRSFSSIETLEISKFDPFIIYIGHF